MDESGASEVFQSAVLRIEADTVLRSLLAQLDRVPSYRHQPHAAGNDVKSIGQSNGYSRTELAAIEREENHYGHDHRHKTNPGQLSSPQ